MWKKTLDDKYEVSTDGRIRNSKTKREIKQFAGSDGYLRTQVAGKTRLVHRLIAGAYIPKDEERDFVNHLDGNKSNNHIDNLEWCTKSENQTHAYLQELRSRPVGTRNGRCKLTNDQVDYIRKHYKPGDRLNGAKPLSIRFGVARQTISAVMSGQNWNKE